MWTAPHPAGQAVLEAKTNTMSPDIATGLLRQYRQSLLRELAEVERLIAEREVAPTGRLFRENNDGTDQRSSLSPLPGETPYRRHRDSSGTDDQSEWIWCCSSYPPCFACPVPKSKPGSVRRGLR